MALRRRVDHNGGLVYVAGPGLSAVTLAVLLQRAGAVRAMELDINSDWVSAFTFDQTDPANPAAVQGVKLLPGREQRTETSFRANETSSRSSRRTSPHRPVPGSRSASPEATVRVPREQNPN